MSEFGPYIEAKGKSIWGTKAMNAGIGLTEGELELMKEECKNIEEKIGQRFTKTALVRFWGRQYFGESTWDEAREKYRPKRSAKRGRGPKATAQSNGPDHDSEDASTSEAAPQ